MRILMVSQLFYPEQFRVNDICFELVKQGHEVTVLTGLPNYPEGIVKEDYKKVRQEEINGVNVIRSWLIGRGSTKKMLFLNYISFAVSASLRILTIKNDFDKIIVYQLSPVTMAIPAIIAKKKMKKPLIIYTHDLWPESIAAGGIVPASRIYKAVKVLSQLIYKQADEIWLSSQMFESYFRDYLQINKPMTYMPVYAEDLFDSIPKREEDGKFNLLFAGNIGNMQSVETILLAAKELADRKEIIFHIVGDGSSRIKCEKLKLDYQLDNVYFHGSHPVESMPYYYALADAFLITLKDHPLISYTLPNKVQSYLAAGKPIIGAINGETAHVISQSNCGFIVGAEDHNALALAIKEFIVFENKDILSNNSKECYIRNFSKEHYFKNLQQVLTM